MDSSIIFLIFVGVAYFLPSLIASGREHPNAVVICLLNLFFGWTLLGWFFALFWSLLAIDKKVQA